MRIYLSIVHCSLAKVQSTAISTTARHVTMTRLTDYVCMELGEVALEAGAYTLHNTLHSNT
jgi:hypothetical protein